LMVSLRVGEVDAETIPHSRGDDGRAPDKATVRRILRRFADYGKEDDGEA
jgi:hypothetical protein